MREVLGGMFLVMFTLKLLGITEVSWWIITAPLWAPLSIVLIVVLCCVIVIGSVSTWEMYQERKAAKKRKELLNLL